MPSAPYPPESESSAIFRDTQILQIRRGERNHQAVRPRCLEYPLAELVGDHTATGHRHLRHLGALDVSTHAHRLPGARCAQDGDDALLVDKLGHRSLGVGSVGSVVFDHDLDLTTVDAALFVDLRHFKIDGVSLRSAKTSVAAGQRHYRADTDRLRIGLRRRGVARGTSSQYRCGQHHRDHSNTQRATHHSSDPLVVPYEYKPTRRAPTHRL